MLIVIAVVTLSPEMRLEFISLNLGGREGVVVIFDFSNCCACCVSLDGVCHCDCRYGGLQASEEPVTWGPH